MEASEETEAAMTISMRAALGLVTNNPNEGHLDDLTIMKDQCMEYSSQHHLNVNGPIGRLGCMCLSVF
ncbi:hypothetical protein MUK42_37042 [Musa troglodytarum]|uniref:Uncharacterized protein n=1 Tax=Musa troglodytarum TaxID=320322 RepID=A0A9E7FM88_9LILI|nr:hypothetical protein MUK42_37042 [Musa troglodytarum]